MRARTFERRRRAAARTALYGSCLTITGLVVALAVLAPEPEPVAHDQTWALTDWEEIPEVDLLRRYVRIDTTLETGSELEGAEFLAAELRQAGLEVRIERLGERGANLWAVLEGEEPEALVLHNHLDVSSPGDLERWSLPPFSGEIDPPWIHGRGVFDMKSVAIAQLMAMREIAASGKRPRRSLIFLATGGEESGSELGTRWILRRHPELVERFWAVLTEGGVVEATDVAAIKYWGIEFAQKRFATGYACSFERSRLEALRSELAELGKSAFPVTLTPEVEAFLTAYAPSRDHPRYQRLFADPAKVLHNWRNFGRLPNLFQSLFRDEIVPFPIREIAGGNHCMKVLLHLLPGSDGAAVRELLTADWLTGDVALTLQDPLGASHGSPIDHPVMTGLVDAVIRRYPGALAGPYLLPWTATDARFFRLAGIPSFGFSPFLIMTTDTLNVDAPNEHMALPGFVDGVELYTEAVVALVN